MSIESLNVRVRTIKGNHQEINIFIEEYKPFIAAYVVKFTGRYMRYGHDDELSIALMAFSEAINHYDDRKGNFLVFAQNVIMRRLIDYFRKENKHNNITFLQEFSEDAEFESPVLVQQALNEFYENALRDLRRLEIEELKKELSQWNISFNDLVDSSPKAKKTKAFCNEIIKFMLNRQDLIERFIKNKQLPIVEIEKEIGIHRKKIERARKYIIAATIIQLGDYQFTREYVNVWRNEN